MCNQTIDMKRMLRSLAKFECNLIDCRTNQTTKNLHRFIWARKKSIGASKNDYHYGLCKMQIHFLERVDDKIQRDMTPKKNQRMLLIRSFICEFGAESVIFTSHVVAACVFFLAELLFIMQYANYWEPKDHYTSKYKHQSSAMCKMPFSNKKWQW